MNTKNLTPTDLTRFQRIHSVPGTRLVHIPLLNLWFLKTGVRGYNLAQGSSVWLARVLESGFARPGAALARAEKTLEAWGALQPPPECPYKVEGPA
jgi:hypothetical protein